MSDFHAHFWWSLLCPCLIETGSSNAKVKVFQATDHLNKKTIKEKCEIAAKLHRQFDHSVNNIKLKKLLKDANITVKELNAQTDSMTDSCDTCDRKVRSPPVLSMPFANISMTVLPWI